MVWRWITWWWRIKGLKLVYYLVWRADATAHARIAHARLHFLTSKSLNVIAFQVNRLSSLYCSPPRHIVCQFQSLIYMPSPRGPLPRHIVCQFQSPYTVLYAIPARSITNQRASSGVGIGFMFVPHVIVPDKRHRVHCKIDCNVANLMGTEHTVWL
jgi:hypothetical protein